MQNVFYFAILFVYLFILHFYFIYFILPQNGILRITDQIFLHETLSKIKILELKQVTKNVKDLIRGINL